MSNWLRSRLAQLAASTLFAASFAAPALADRNWRDHDRGGHRHERGCGHDGSGRYDRGHWGARYAPYRYQRAPYDYARAGYRCGCGKHWRSRDKFARHLYRQHPRAYYAWFGN